MDPWLVRRVVVPLYERLSGRAPWSEWQRLRRLQWQSRAELELQALARLRPLLAHAQEHVPYYRELFARSGFSIADVRQLADLARLPITSKNDLRAGFPGRVVADDLPESRRRLRVTGGSTGTPFRFFVDRGLPDYRLGTYLLFREWAGGAASDARLHIASPAHFADRPSRVELEVRRLFLGERLVVVSGAELSLSAFREWVERLSRRRSYFIWTYPSYAAHLAAEILAGRLTIACHPKFVLCYAETLTEVDIAQIERAFHCRVVNLYSCMEVPLLALTCPDQPQVLHVNNQRAVVRVVRADGSDAAPGERGRIVVTDLANYVMPLINYELGDIAEAGAACACGRGFPTLARIEGRVAEVIRTADGRIVPPSALSGLVLEDPAADSIAQYQAEQIAPDAVVLRLVPIKPISTDALAHLQQGLVALLGADMQAKVELVEQIPLTPAGKRLIIRSRLPE